MSHDDFLMINKYEKKALRWVVGKLIPTAEFVRTGRQGLRRHEMAEYFGVAGKFVEIKCQVLKVREEVSEETGSWAISF